ncbi:hypothetical protein Tco_1288863 [Tanacetum coccineum]
MAARNPGCPVGVEASSKQKALQRIIVFAEGYVLYILGSAVFKEGAETEKLEALVAAVNNNDKSHLFNPCNVPNESTQNLVGEERARQQARDENVADDSFQLEKEGESTSQDATMSENVGTSESENKKDDLMVTGELLDELSTWDALLHAAFPVGTVKVCNF